MLIWSFDKIEARGSLLLPCASWGTQDEANKTGAMIRYWIAAWASRQCPKKLTRTMTVLTTAKLGLAHECGLSALDPIPAVTEIGALPRGAVLAERVSGSN